MSSTQKLKRVTVHFNNAAEKLTDREKYNKLTDVINHVFYLSSQGHDRDLNVTYYTSPNPDDHTFVFDCTDEVAQKLQKAFPDATIEPGGTPFGVMMRESDRFFRNRKPPRPQG